VSIQKKGRSKNRQSRRRFETRRIQANNVNLGEGSKQKLSIQEKGLSKNRQSSQFCRSKNCQSRRRSQLKKISLPPSEISRYAPASDQTRIFLQFTIDQVNVAYGMNIFYFWYHEIVINKLRTNLSNYHAKQM